MLGVGWLATKGQTRNGVVQEREGRARRRGVYIIYAQSLSSVSAVAGMHEVVHTVVSA